MSNLSELKDTRGLGTSSTDDISSIGPPSGFRNRMARLKKAWIAVRALFDNPDDSKQVFRVVSALRGKSLERGLDRFKSTEVGSRILREEIDLLDTLKQRNKLVQYGQGTFAATYLRFVKTEELSADGLVEASYEAVENIQDPELLRYINRIRDMHDLWHSLTQYGREPLGEGCLLAFTYAQLRSPGAAFIVILGARRLARGYGRGTLGALWRADRDGKKAKWLAAQPFEELLSREVSEVRSILSISEPTVYWKILDRHGLR